MLQGANTDLFNPLTPKAYNGECQKSQISFKNQAAEKSDEAKFADFQLCH